MEIKTLYSYFTIVMEMFYQSQYVVRIVGGRSPAPNENKYIVSFQLKTLHYKIYGSGHFCGGIILNSNYILSAAHCFDNKKYDDFLALIGIYSLYVENPAVFHSEIKMIILHPNFDRKSHSNDIAVVHLIKHIPDYKFRLLPLYVQEVPVAKKCHLLGWGQIYDGGPRADVLYAVSFVTRSIEFCFVDAKRSKIMLCVGSYNNSYACHGDSGGPLICDNQIAGILSHGWGCEPFAFVFTRVSDYAEWILRGFGIPNKSYNKIIILLIAVILINYF